MLTAVSSGIRSAKVSWFDQEYRSSIRRLLHQEYLAEKKYIHWKNEYLSSPLYPHYIIFMYFMPIKQNNSSYKTKQTA